MNLNPPSDYYFQEYGDLTEMPLSVLQLDPADRAVIRIAGTSFCLFLSLDNGLKTLASFPYHLCIIPM